MDTRFRGARFGASARRCVALAIAASVLLTGCTERPDLGGVAGAGGKSLSGAVREYPKPATPVVFSGRTVDGGRFRSSAYRGRVLVVNFWYAGCPPCRAEAPTLERLYRKFQPQRVQFVGVNVRDEAPPAKAFDRDFGITYPSILDAQGGEVQYAFSRTIPANAVPTTLVLDQQGRVRARIVGQIPAASILSTLITDAVSGRAQ